MCNNLYMLLLQYFDSPKRDDKNRQEIELSACRCAITELIPILESRVYKCKPQYMPQYYELWTKSYAFAGRRSLEHFIDYMEMEKAKRVLASRRKVLKPFIFYLNRIAFSEKLQYIIASYPPSTGKSFSLNYFTAWLFGLDINNSVLRLSYSDELVLSFSRSIQEIIRNPRYSDVFPQFKVYGTKPFSKEKESDWQIKGAETLTSHIARTRDGSVTGVRANKAIIFDDMTKGASEATNSALHSQLYDKWKTEWYNRRDGSSTKFIFAGTMWSPEDILNRVTVDRESLSEVIKSKNFKYAWETKDGSTVFIRVPLLDENDETTCEDVMSTKEARQLRDTTDEFLFSCVYQQDPIAPTGLEFADELLQHYEELPRDKDGNEDCLNYTFAVLDPARKGKDNVSMPIFKIGKNDNKYYFVDSIFQKKAMTELYDLIVEKIIEHTVTKFVIENNTDTSLKVVIEERLRAKGYYICEIIEKYNTVNKEQRIKDARGDIRKFIVFKDKKMYKPNSDYGRFMKNFTTYSFDYPNKFDDAPDSMAMFRTEIILDRAKPSKPKPIARAILGI